MDVLGIILLIIFLIFCLTEFILLTIRETTKEVQKAYKYRDKENEEDKDYFSWQN